VGIWQDGELIKTIDLSAVTSEYELTVEYEGRKNVIRVGPGRIEVLEADCPDGTCVKRGELSSGRTPIVCLPNRLVIRYMDSPGGIDAVAGGAG
jgi:hypothetical protein